MMETEAEYAIGQLVTHKIFGYRGVIVDIDPEFQLTDEWYDSVAKSKPPKNAPWYHVLVHNALHQTYVAQQNLQTDSKDVQIFHPRLGRYFNRFIDGKYHLIQKQH